MKIASQPLFGLLLAAGCAIAAIKVPACTPPAAGHVAGPPRQRVRTTMTTRAATDAGETAE